MTKINRSSVYSHEMERVATGCLDLAIPLPSYPSSHFLAPWVPRSLHRVGSWADRCGSGVTTVLQSLSSLKKGLRAVIGSLARAHVRSHATSGVGEALRVAVTNYNTSSLSYSYSNNRY